MCSLWDRCDNERLKLKLIIFRENMSEWSARQWLGGHGGSLAESDHMTWILASDWLRVIT